MKSKTLILTVLLSVQTIIFSQNYTVEHSESTYLPLSNANLVDETNAGVDGSGSELYQAIPIGFDFVYHNNSFNSLKVGQNGYVIFEQNGVFKSFINIFECNQKNFQDNPLLSPIYYEVSGEPGNQIFKLEFVKSGFVADSEENDFINYQLWIYEYCNVFEFHFGEKSIDSLEFDLFYNGSPAPFIGYGNNNPYIFYVLDGSLTFPSLSTNAAHSLDSVPNINSVYTFRNCYLDVIENESNSVKIYPNPVSDQINFSIDDGGEEAKLSIMNLNGQIVLNEEIYSDSSFDVSFLSQGVYIVNVVSYSKTYSTKFVKL